MIRFSEKKRTAILVAAARSCGRAFRRPGIPSENRILLFVLLLCSLLLTGCADAPAPVVAEATAPTAAPAALYDPGSPMEQETRGAVRTYPLPMADAYGIRTMGEDLLLFSGTSGTRLTLLSGEDLYPAASVSLDFYLTPEDPSLVIFDRGLSFFDPAKQKTVVLDSTLTEIRAIAAPQDLVGRPILSQDGRTLYYCTANAIRAWDLNSGLRRMLKSISGAALTALHGNDTLQCTAGGRGMVLALADGRLLWEGDPAMTFTARGSRYFASVPVGLNKLLLFGRAGEDPWALTTADFNDGICRFLVNQNAAVTAVTGREAELSCYDLATGRRSSILTLPTAQQPVIDAAKDGRVWVLAADVHDGGMVLYRWDTAALPAEDPGIYTFPHFTAKAPDREGLARCRTYADDIGSRYGIRVLIGPEAADTQPWDYDFQPEHLVPFLERELQLLDECLSHYPNSVLEDTVSHFSSLTICLVRSITGTAESGSIEEANGLQFLNGTDMYLALAVGPHSDHPLYHELFHVMETHLLGGSTAFDQWDNINPPDFVYDYSYTPGSRDDGQYLQGGGRAFIDRYSMSFPKEDRARIMEYAMTPGHEALFRHKLLQAKLETLCKAIRQAYGLKKSPEAFLWEQYLNTPMAYAGS